MSVKTIFKVLIGTIFIMIAGSLCAELFNVNVASHELRSLCNLSANQAAELFTQETYKESPSGVKSKSTNMEDILDSDGNLFVTGEFYGSSKTDTDSAIWTDLYVDEKTSGVSDLKQVLELENGKSVELSSKIKITGDTEQTTTVKTKYILMYADNLSYKQVLESTITTTNPSGNTYPKYIIKENNSSEQIKDAFTEVAELYAGLYGQTDITNANVSTVSFTYKDFTTGENSVLLKIAQKSFANTANKMKEQYYTPVNIGFPYFSPTVTNKMFRWNLAKILSGGNSDSIQKDETEDGGRYYVVYKGFKCYVQEAYIKEIRYYIYNIDNADDIEALKEQTGINADSIAKIGTDSSGNNNGNNYITVAGIIYSIPVSYKGITPFKNIINFKWSSNVTEINQVAGEIEGNDDELLMKFIEGTETEYDSNTVEMTNEDDGTVAQSGATGEIYYVLTR